jgi:uncharacterized protein YfaS (alpha-2-macroglobulin family)
VQTLLPFWFAQGDGGSGCPSSPAVLRLETDQPVYKPGDQARLTFSAREPGQGLLCTGTDRLQAAVPFAVSAGQNTVLVPVPADTPYGSLYAGVTVVRAEIPASQVPRRRFGLARLSLDQSSRRLNVAVAVAPEPRPGTTARVRVSLTSGTKPAAGAVQLLAVDEGLLALTGRATPDPFAFFFGDRRCAVQFTDVYDRIFPELDLKLAGESHPGGDGYDERLAPALPPQLKPAVVVLPLVQVPAGGETEVDLPLPEHQGELRIMAVATNALAVGSTQASVRLRREVTILLTAPKAVAPGDEFELTAQVTNHQLPETEFGFALTASGPVAPAGAAPAGLRLAKGADGSLRCRFRAQAETAGRADFAAEVRAGELRFGSTTLTAVRPATPPRFRSGCLQVPASRSREVELPQGWLPGTGRGRLEVSAWQGTEVLGPLAWLRRYPYGCLEQTVSAAFPLLFLPAEPRLAGGEKSPSLSGEVGAAIRRVLLMELPAGGFAMWPGDPHLWSSGSVYTAHFLAEARHSGYEVDEALWDRTVTFLRRAARSNDPPQPLGERGYLLYVLAATGRAESGLAETLLADRDAPRGARLLAAAALARAGRARTGAEALPQLQEGAVPAADAPPAFDLDSPVRRAALELWARLDLEPDSASVPHLLARLQEQRSAEGHWGSTHDNALAVAALLRWAGQCPQDPATTGQVEGPDGQSHAVSQASPYSVLDPPSGGRFRISSAGPGALFCTWESSGVPLALAAEAVADGIAVERHYLDESGRPKAEFRHGDAVFVKLVLRSSGPLANVVVADLLPGALESEESLAAVRCCTQEEVRNLAVHHVEKRDDRVLLFCDLSGGGEAAFAYGTRAVSRGRFTVPAVSAEAMYRPRTRAYRFDGRQISVE